MKKMKSLSRSKLLFVTSLLSLLVGGSYVASSTSFPVINTRKNATDTGDTQGNAETIELNMATGDEGVVVTVFDHLSPYNAWVINASSDDYIVTLEFTNTDKIAGSYTFDTYDPYTYIQNLKTSEKDQLKGTCTVTDTDGVINVKGDFVGQSGQAYKLNLTYGTPTSTGDEETTKINIATGEGVSIDVHDFFSLYGFWTIEAMNADYYLTLCFNDTDQIAGSHTIDATNEYSYIQEMKTMGKDFVTGSCTVTDTDGVINLKGDFVGESGKAYQLDLTYGIPTPVAHEHDYSDEWSHDDSSHWHECNGSGDCDALKADEAEHVYGDEEESRYTCSVCGHVNETLKERYLNQDVAGTVIALINEIGDVDESNASKEKIEAAREAYNKLTPAQKELINNYQKLTEAEDTYAELVKPTNPNKDVEKGMPGGLIALIVILSLIFFTILALIVLFILDRKNILVLSVLHEVFDMIPFFKNKKEEKK